MAVLFYELIRPGWGGMGTDFFQKKHWDCLGVQLEATTFFTAKISPNCNPKINFLTLSEGFPYENFKNFGRKIDRKGGVPHISTISFFNTILKKKKKKNSLCPVAKLGEILL